MKPPTFWVAIATDTDATDTEVEFWVELHTAGLKPWVLDGPFYDYLRAHRAALAIIPALENVTYEP